MTILIILLNLIVKNIRIFEEHFDIREKRSNFVYRHGLEYVLVWYLKFTHFLPIR